MPITLVNCPDRQSYLRIAHIHSRELVPILADPFASLLGFPRATEFAAYDVGLSKTEPCPIQPTDPRRICIALREPWCEAIGAYLAEETGRALLIADPGTFTETLDEALARDPLSLALITPGWNEAVPDSRWIAHSLLEIRRRGQRLNRLPWGLITGANASAASRIAAKAVLQEAIIADYSHESSLIFTTASRKSVGSSLAPLTSDCSNPLQHVDASQVRDKTAMEILNRRWNLIFFSGHGRSYCGCQGYLCGARTLQSAPESVAEHCVFGMDCASPHDDSWVAGFPGFPRIDPRRYDTPFMVTDACGTGSWAFPTWQEGTPSVTYHAAAGAPSAIITGDQVTMHQPGSFSDVLWALTAATSAGRAVAYLNEVRHEAGAEWPYYLVGDPEVPCGAARWPSWTGEVEILQDERLYPQRRLFVRGATSRPFSRLALGAQPSAARTGTWTTSLFSDPGTTAANPRVFSTRDRTDVWFTARAQDTAASIDVTVEHGPSPQIPPGLADAALRISAEVRGWQTPLREAGAKMMAAAEQVLRIAKLLERAESQAVVGRYEDLRTSSELAVQAWMGAHREAVNAALGLAGNGLWPYRLWSVSAFRNRTADEPCPYCRVAPTLRRTYDRFGGSRREQWECPSCSLLQDHPANDATSVNFYLDEVLRTGTSLPATVTITDNTQNTHWMGCGAILVDGHAHGVASDRESFDICVEPGGTSAATTTLSQRGLSPIRHRYWARCLLLLNGIWSLRTKPIVLVPDLARSTPDTSYPQSD